SPVHALTRRARRRKRRAPRRRVLVLPGRGTVGCRGPLDPQASGAAQQDADLLGDRCLPGVHLLVGQSGQQGHAPFQGGGRGRARPFGHLLRVGGADQDVRHVFSRGRSARHGRKTVGFRCCPPGGPGPAPSGSPGRILAERDRVGGRMVGGTVDFYVRDFPGLVRLSVAAARAFRSPALMAGAEEARFFVDLEALVGVPGSAEVTVEELLDESGEGEEMFSGTALESCRYEISVEFSRRTEAEAPGQGRSIGRKLFQRLVALSTPMVYAVRDAEALAAEFSPENGVRDFTPPVDITDESLKAESVLSSPVPRSSPGKPGPTAANVS